MAKKQVSKTVKRRLRAYIIILLPIVIFCVFTILSYAFRIQELKKEEAALNKQLSSLKLEAEELTSEISKLKDPDYIAKYARENYYYTKDGEYVIKIEKEEDTDEATEVEDTRSYYVLAVGVIIILILITIIKTSVRRKEKNKKPKKKSN